MPWAGATENGGSEAIVDTCSQVMRYWRNEGFEISETFEAEGKVAVFGHFRYRSVTVGKLVSSPFSIFARVHEGKVTYMQFMEDTFATAATFRAGGETIYRADPDGGEVML